MKFDASLLVHNLEQMPTLAHFEVQDSVDVPLDARRVSRRELFVQRSIAGIHFYAIPISRAGLIDAT